MRVWLVRLAEFISHSPVLPIDYVGLGSELIRNPPFPLLEICFAVEGSYDDLVVGNRFVGLPHGGVSLHTVQFGNRATGAPGARCWCVFFDIAGVPEFETFLREPLAWRCLAANPEPLAGAFETLSIRCRMPPCGVAGEPYTMARRERHSRFVSWSVKAAALELLATLLDTVGGGAADVSVREPQAVWRAREYMARHFADATLSLRGIAAAAHLSAAHFGRLFREITGTTPLGYLRALRIEQSRFLLDRTSRRINEIATEVGFSDPLYFSRVFRGIVGVSPRAYRQRHGAGMGTQEHVSS